MRGALHVMGTLVLIPYVAFAAAFAMLGQAIARKSLFGFLDALLSQALWLMPWGLLGIIAAIVLVAGFGLSARLRWLGGVCLCLIAASCIAVLVVVSTSPTVLSEMLFLSPCIGVMIFGAWLAVVEWRARR